MTDDIDENGGGTLGDHIADERLAHAIRELRSPVATDAARFDARVLGRMQHARAGRYAGRAWIAAAALAAAFLIAASVHILDAAHHTATHATPTTRLVQFRLDDVRATSVAVAGSFNGWNPQATPLHRSADGAWVADVPLRPGRHVYQFVVDRTRWIPDPHSPRDPGDDFGTPNSVITVLPHGSGS